jgi:hypothetical protein
MQKQKFCHRIGFVGMGGLLKFTLYAQLCSFNQPPSSP